MIIIRFDNYLVSDVIIAITEIIISSSIRHLIGTCEGHLVTRQKFELTRSENLVVNNVITRYFYRKMTSGTVL